MDKRKLPDWEKVCIRSLPLDNSPAFIFSLNGYAEMSVQ